MSSTNNHRNGMTLFYNNKDYFFVTKQTRRTDKLLRHIAVTLRRAKGHHNTVLSDIPDSTLDFLRFRVRPATLERKVTSAGRCYFNINTEDSCVSYCTEGDDLMIYELGV